MGAMKVDGFTEGKNVDGKKMEVDHWALRKTNVWELLEKELTKDTGRWERRRGCQTLPQFS